MNGAGDGSRAEANLQGQMTSLRGCLRALEAAVERAHASGDVAGAVDEVVQHWRNILEGFPPSWESPMYAFELWKRLAPRFRLHLEMDHGAYVVSALDGDDNGAMWVEIARHEEPMVAMLAACGRLEGETPYQLGHYRKSEGT